MALAALLATVALAICSYRFGVNDQAQYLVQWISGRDASALPGDPYLGVFQSLRSSVWTVLGQLVPEAFLPAVCLALAWLTTFANAILLLAIGRHFFRNHSQSQSMPRWTGLLLASLPALLLVVPKEQNWFGLVAISDVEFTATSAVMPLVFGSLLAWIRGRPAIALLCAIAAAPIQGQTAAYLLTTWTVASFWTARRSPRALVAPTVVFVLALLLLLRERAASVLSPDDLGSYEAIGRGLYPELINPLTGGASAWAAVGVVLGLGVIALFRRRTCDRLDQLLLWGIASLAFPAIGLCLLAADVRDPFLWKLMVGRAFMLPQITALIIFGVVSSRRLLDEPAARPALTLALAGVVAWPWPALPRVVSAVALTALALLWLWPVAAPRFQCIRQPRSAVALLLFMLIGLGAARFATRPFPWLASGEWTPWQDVQEWARQETATSDRFLTPPYRSGWRVGSRRTTWGELKDGGLMFYTGTPALEWEQRMARIGASSPYQWMESGGPQSERQIPRSQPGLEYVRALQRDGLRLCQEGAIDWIVIEGPATLSWAEPVWTNGVFTVHRPLPENSRTNFVQLPDRANKGPFAGAVSANLVDQHITAQRTDARTVLTR